MVGDFKTKIMLYLKDPKAIPHFLFYSKAPGTGKTTLAKAIINELGCDALVINSSDDRKIETVRERVKEFSITKSSRDDVKRLVFLDECDGMLKASQDALRNIMETYSSNVSFILTCVDKNTKIYLPCGYKRVQDITNDNILTYKNILLNKNTIKQKKSIILNIQTLHQQNIKVTPEHKFYINNNWIEAKDLKVGDRIDIRLDSLYGKNIELENDKYSMFDKNFIDNFKKYLILKGYFTKEVIDEINTYYKKSLLPQHEELINKMELEKEYTIFELMKLDNNKLKKHRYNNHIAYLKQLGLIKTVSNNRQARYIRIGNINEHYNFYQLRDYINKKFNTQYNTKQIYNIYRCQSRALIVEDIISDLKNVLNITSLDYDKISSLGRLVGFIFGDGHIDGGYGIQCAGNKECLEIVKDDIHKFFDCDLTTIHNGHKSGNGYCFNIRSHKSFGEFLVFIGCPYKGKVGQVMMIPRICYRNKLLMKSFIQGLFDCESLTPVLNKNNTGINQIRFGQHNIISLFGKDNFFSELVDVLNKMFDINSYHNYIIDEKEDYKYIKEKRIIKSLNINKQLDILNFMKNIGFYYEHYKIKLDLFGYLIYKQSMNNTYQFLTFDEWRSIYYDKDLLKDEIVSIEEYNGEFEVYDLSLDSEHSYISNGFISHNCNNINKVIEPLKSRCVMLPFAYPDKKEIKVYLSYVCQQEKMEFTDEGLDVLIDLNYPSIRNCVLGLQDLYTQQLAVVTENIKPVNEIFDEMWKLYKEKKWYDIKTVVLQSTVEPRELNTFFWHKFLDENNTKGIQITCRNEKDISTGADAKIVFVTSLIEMVK